jgi:hypothetical protein
MTSIRYQNQMASLFVACAFGSAIIALWTIYLPTASNSILSDFAPLKATEMVEEVRKADRLPRLRFEDRRNPVLTIQRASSTASRIEKNPVGCETPFSRLSKAQNFLARCLASNNEITFVQFG